MSNSTKIVRLVGGLTAAGALMFTAACGSNSGTESVANSGKATDPMAAFTACLQKQGVTLPNGGRGGPGGQPDGNPPTGRPTGRPTGHPTGTSTARPTGRPSGMPSLSADQQKAMQTCASLRPQGGPPDRPAQEARAGR